MSIKTLVVAFLALLCGGSAAFMVVLLNGRSGEAAAVETVPVVVAAVDVGRGISLAPEMLAVRQWPKDSAPHDRCATVDEVVGKSSRTSLMRDEPFMKSRLAKGSGLNALIPAGMRAYTILTPSASAGVGGFIQPEDRVDVILTVTSVGPGDERRTGGGLSTILLQNVQVLAAGKSLQAEPEDTKLEGRQLNSVTLLVTPRQAQELTLAQTKGTLNLALRREGDSVGESQTPLFLNDLALVGGSVNSEEQEEGQAKEEKEEKEEPVAAPPPPPAPVVVAPRRVVSQIRISRGFSREQLFLQSGKTLTAEELEPPQPAAAPAPAPETPPAVPTASTEASQP